MDLTDEQKAICDNNSARVQINAFAGTGKTTTLLHYAKKNSHKSMLYLCYNKNIEVEAKRIFPSNVTVRTTHSLGYGAIGYKYKAKFTPSINAKSILSLCNLKTNMPGYEMAKIILGTLKNFLSSADTIIKPKHAPYDDIHFAAHAFKKNNNIDSFIEEVSEKASFMASKVWHKMCDKNCLDIGMTHDGYLKLFQLSNPVIRYNVLLLDEAQDATPSTLAAVMGAQVPQLIMVGDTHQAIYGFRGSVDAMRHRDDFEQFSLTSSFRFGKTIADAANMVLALKGETRRIKGEGGADALTNLQQNMPGTKAIIFRHNISFWREALGCGADYGAGVGSGVGSMGKNKIFIEGGILNYNYAKLMDIYRLYRKEKPIDPLIARYDDYSDFKKTTENMQDTTLFGLCCLIEDTCKKSISGLGLKMNVLEKSIVTEVCDANLILTNTHKAKGKEYAKVVIFEDFTNSPFNSKMKGDINIYGHPESYEGLLDSVSPKMEEEASILYVAITRARQMLSLPKNYIKNLNIAQNIAFGSDDENFYLKLEQNKHVVSNTARAYLQEYRLKSILIDNKLPVVRRSRV